jgi:hypothetical protein
MIFFFDIKEEFQSNHKEKRSSKASYYDLGRFQDVGISILIKNSKLQGLENSYMSYDAHDQERKNNSHPKNGDRHSPGQKPMLPLFIHFFQNICIDDGIIKR